MIPMTGGGGACGSSGSISRVCPGGPIMSIEGIMPTKITFSRFYLPYYYIKTVVSYKKICCKSVTTHKPNVINTMTVFFLIAPTVMEESSRN